MWIDDQILKQFKKTLHAEIFVPQTTCVVLGSGNDEALEVNLESCQESSISVMRRYGGGGTVVLYPGCVVVSLGCWVKEQFQNTLYFRLINQGVINSLATTWPNLNDLSQAGLSDITLGDKKIAGTSLFRSRNYLLYQASLLVDLDHELVSRALRHPTKEPDYRHGRSHDEFLTSLMIAESKISSATQVAKELKNNFHDCVRKVLGDHLIEPIAEQTPALMARLERSPG